MLILGIETSCDETAVAVVENGNNIIYEYVNSQVEIHSKFGGIVPEIASRKHIESIFLLLEKLFSKIKYNIDDIDAIAVTCKPGLIGALLVGVTTAKTIAYAMKKPLIPVNHLLGHYYSLSLTNKIQFPFLGLLVSGGHTILANVKSEIEYEIIGQTLDDAAGEAYDKVAKMLGLSYPGGPVIEKYAEKGEPVIDFPRAMLKKKNKFDFSFSGLKTAVLYYLKQNKNYLIEDVCSSFQNAVFDVLKIKLLKASEKYRIKKIGVCGGVSANQTLKKELSDVCNKNNIELYYPEFKYSLDNANMIAGVGYHIYKKNINKNQFDIKNLLRLNAFV